VRQDPAFISTTVTSLPTSRRNPELGPDVAAADHEEALGMRVGASAPVLDQTPSRRT